MLHLPSGTELRGVVIDISRGGVALRCDWSAEAGTEVRVELPGVAQPIAARCARAAGGSLALAFHQEEATLRLVDKALAAIGARTTTAAA
jgi:hypothetical protein